MSRKDKCSPVALAICAILLVVVCIGGVIWLGLC